MEDIFKLGQNKYASWYKSPITQFVTTQQNANKKQAKTLGDYIILGQLSQLLVLLQNKLQI